jgi:hypothetical protein
VWWVVVVVESKSSDRLWLSFSLALAKPNNYSFVLTNQSCEYKWGVGTMTVLCIAWAVIGEADN